MTELATIAPYQPFRPQINRAASDELRADDAEAVKAEFSPALEAATRMRYARNITIAAAAYARIGEEVQLWKPPASEPSPFDDLIDVYHFAIRQAIDSIRRKAQISHASRIADRLAYLREAAEEEADETRPNPNSIRRFFEFLTLHKRLRYPDLSLTPDGEIYAQWRESADRQFSLVFLPDGTIHFVLFAPNKGKPDMVVRIHGVESYRTVLENLQLYGIQQWIIDEADDTG